MILVSCSVLFVIGSQSVYNYGFEKYDIANSTGINAEQLKIAGGQIRDYFSNDEQFIKITIRKHGTMVPNLFNNREILHMKDVKALVKLVQRTQIISVLTVIMCIIAGFFIGESRHLSRSIIWLGRGGILAILLTGLVGVLSLGGFDRLFLYFHLVSFSNDLWILDPSRDYLIAMFPQGFFFDATMLIGGIIMAQGLLLALLPRILRLFWKI
jgi:integral membrane protein (TIGR01906 family)|tara:strand:- start:40 stop:675 length:636 start_codon:yes stop_codon:yes gene_type:complete